MPWRLSKPMHSTAWDSEKVKEIITKEMVVWAIHTFSPYKSAGLDEISPIMLQKSLSDIIETLVRINHGCRERGKSGFHTKSGKNKPHDT